MHSELRKFSAAVPLFSRLYGHNPTFWERLDSALYSRRDVSSSPDAVRNLEEAAPRPSLAMKILFGAGEDHGGQN